MMKKQFRKILCSIMSTVILFSGATIMAESSAESPMQMSWSADYSDSTLPKLMVEFTNDALYKQKITAVIYPTAVTTPSLSDYVQITDFITEKGKTETITFNILDSYDYDDEYGGKYTVKFSGSGYQRETDKIDVDVILPSEIPGLLEEFRTATESSFAGVLAKVNDALQLDSEPDSERKTERIKIMFNIKANDYNGTFQNLEDIRESWSISDVIAYITDDTATKEGLRNKIERNSAALGIDINNEIYKTYIDDVCGEILNYSAEYNNNKGVLCVTDLKGIIQQYIGLKRINEASTETIYNVFDIYKSYFGIPSDKLAVYTGYQSTGHIEYCDIVLRYLYNKNFVKNADLVNAFSNGIKAVENQLSDGTVTPPVIVVTPQGGGSSSSSFPGGGSAPSVPTTPTTKTVFSDLPSSHWAYAYVTKLADKGVIGGYDDGTFKPNNNVTREEFVKMIIEATGLVMANAECDFSDVPKNAWYYEYVASGYVNEIVGGTDNATFGVGRNITRQDVAVIAARVLTRLNAQIPDIESTTLTDINSVSDYAQDSVKLLNSMGIISGFDDGSYMPHNALTRAEAAAIISRLTANL